ncbi:hypothetical protein [Streptomyces sp. CA-132043]|uniref:hypothetical protein n=1 Tax=Streptomyces sp. CA-132043 TaxID=3240048 RepID=UPI003D92F7FB
MPSPLVPSVPAGADPLGRSGEPGRLGGLSEAEWLGAVRVGDGVAEPVLADGLGPEAVDDGEGLCPGPVGAADDP